MDDDVNSVVGAGLAVLPFTAADAAGAIGQGLLRLNNAHQTELSALTGDGLAGLVRAAFWAGRIGTGAFLLAFDEGSDYGGGNFRWFRSRRDRFVYVDRVVVAPRLRGRGAARALYAAVAARAAGHGRLTCEVNVRPPNEGSMRMHERFGFVPVGEGPAGAGKWVRYLERMLP